jgi:sulfate adenylyltransferase subunit 1
MPQWKTGKKRDIFNVESDMMAEDKQNSRNFSSGAYLGMELLRFTTAGSVDDGKSTLIGRLLYDSKSIFEDQLDAVQRASVKKGSEHLNLALFTDGLRAEREQGITIDVAYRYFATPKRKFIIADTPGHIQYTRNMVTGASTANAAIILIDARNGVTEQTYRHTFIASLLEIPHIIVCINKMDLLDYRQDAFNRIKEDFLEFSSRAFPGKDLHFIPISALFGDNVVTPSAKMPWFSDGTLLHVLETLPVQKDYDLVHPRFPVQYVIRPESKEFHDYRGYGGRVAGGIFKNGDKVVVFPNRISTSITSIDTYEGPVEEAFPPLSVAFTLKDDVDISRGDLITGIDDLPRESDEIDVMICWMNPRPMQIGGKYSIKHTTRDLRSIVKRVDYVMNINTLEHITGVTQVKMNDIARIRLRTTKPVFYDPYSMNRITGSLILIDESTHETVAAGMIL